MIDKSGEGRNEINIWCFFLMFGIATYNARRLDHGSCSWPTQWTMTKLESKLCRVMSRTCIRLSSGTPVARAKSLKIEATSII